MKPHALWSSRFARRATCALIAAVCSLAFAGGALAQSPRYEYVVRNAKYNNRVLEAMLNDYSANGWDLVQIERGVAIFRRPVAARR